MVNGQVAQGHVHQCTTPTLVTAMCNRGVSPFSVWDQWLCDAPYVTFLRGSGGAGGGRLAGNRGSGGAVFLCMLVHRGGCSCVSECGGDGSLGGGPVAAVRGSVRPGAAPLLRARGCAFPRQLLPALKLGCCPWLCPARSSLPRPEHRDQHAPHTGTKKSI